MNSTDHPNPSGGTHLPPNSRVRPLVNSPACSRVGSEFQRVLGELLCKSQSRDHVLLLKMFWAWLTATARAALPGVWHFEH